MPFEDMKPKDRIYYFKLVLAIITGFVNSFLWLTDFQGVIMAVVVLILSYFTALYVLRIDPEEIGGKTKLLTTGIGTYLLVGILTWTILYNLYNLPIIMTSGFP